MIRSLAMMRASPGIRPLSMTIFPRITLATARSAGSLLLRLRSQPPPSRHFISSDSAPRMVEPAPLTGFSSTPSLDSGSGETIPTPAAFVFPPEHQQCKGCGSQMQVEFPDKPGFSPRHVVEEFLGVLAKEKAQGIQEPPEGALYSVPSIDDQRAKAEEAAADEDVEEQQRHLARNRDGKTEKEFQEDAEENDPQDYEAYLARSRTIPTKPSRAELRGKRTTITCARCYQLQHYGLLKGNTEVAKPEDFRAFLKQRFEENQNAVIIKLVDMFDFNGSFIPDFAELVGKNPVILVGNKVDLLPKGAGMLRVQTWLKREALGMGLKPHNICLVSSTNGFGVEHLLKTAKKLAVKASVNRQRETWKEREKIFEARKAAYEAQYHNMKGLNAVVGIKTAAQEEEEKEEDKKLRHVPGVRDIYVVGTTNVGKSTLINQMIKQRLLMTKRAQLVTTSPLPGTTLGLVAFPVSTSLKLREQDEADEDAPYKRTTLYDSPGVINPHQLSSNLTFEELQAVLPTSRISPVTYRLKAGQSLLLGAFARIDFLEGRPFFFTSVVSPRVSIHVTDQNKVSEIWPRHAGNRESKFLVPPYTPERVAQVGLTPESPSYTMDVQGRGWEEAAADVVFPGLGWVGLTGSGSLKLRVFPPNGVPVFLRDPLMPYESHTTTRKHTGSPRKY